MPQVLNELTPQDLLRKLQFHCVYFHMTNSQQLVQKLWNYCNILRDDGLSYGDYVEQLTYLLFLKMADEQSRIVENFRCE